ncbi:MAG: hypothetical protein R3293_12860 [Candidatus Promineifilaceae bacterium]|nr:hypothetical protein [Candidatus Promineifilaceae bacterium]
MNRNIVIVGLILMVGFILVAGGFTAVRLMSAGDGERDLPAGAMVFEDVMDDGSGNPVTVKTVILPASELPQRPSEASGVLVKQEDNSYFVGTGSVSVSINVVNGETSTAVEHSGPEIEVVAQRDTQYYRDVTEVSFESAESKEQTLQQEVILVDQPAEMPSGANMQVWGEKRGDRVVADIIVYSEVR